jgi:hypothetical protein
MDNPAHDHGSNVRPRRSSVPKYVKVAYPAGRPVPWIASLWVGHARALIIPPDRDKI